VHKWNALKSSKEQKVIVIRGTVASCRSSGGDTGCGNEPALLRRRRQLHIEEKRHGSGGGMGVRELELHVLSRAGLVSNKNGNCMVLCVLNCSN
jgi:hypothetical protein